MKRLLSLFKRKSNLVPNESSINPKLKLRRNQIEHKKYFEFEKKARSSSKFATDFKIHAKENSISISKSILSGNPKLAAKQYLKIISEYRKYIILTGVSEKSTDILLNKYKFILFQNMVSIIKKQIPKEVIRKQSILSESKRKEIEHIEHKLIIDLLNLGLIKDPKYIPIRFTELNSIEGIIDSYNFDDNPQKLFKDICDVYLSAKEGKRSPSLDNLVKGWSKIDYSNNKLNEYNSISINTNVKHYKQVILHELLHTYLKRESFIYAKNEVVIEFLSMLFTNKYFSEYQRRDPSMNLEKNQYYIGNQLYNKYKLEYGLDLRNIDQFLIENKEYIQKHTFR